jgi:hypothetical protein
MKAGTAALLEVCCIAYLYTVGWSWWQLVLLVLICAAYQDVRESEKKVTK